MIAMYECNCKKSNLQEKIYPKCLHEVQEKKILKYYWKCSRCFPYVGYLEGFTYKVYISV